MVYNPPPNGYVINDATYGTIFIGEDDPKNRQRQIEIHAASDAAIKLFKDGGFEIQSQPSAKCADNILSQAPASVGGLQVKANRIHFDGGEEITFTARSIIFESTASDQNFSIRANKNLELSADNIKIHGSEVAIGAKNRMVIRSKGPLYINSDAGVFIVEPKLTLTPTNLLSIVQTLATNIFNF